MRGKSYKPKSVSRKGSMGNGGIVPKEVNRPSTPGGVQDQDRTHVAQNGMDGQALSVRKSQKRRDQLGK